MGCRQNRTAHRCRGVPGPPAPATVRSAARTRAARPRSHRGRPATALLPTADRPVHEARHRAEPDYLSRSGPGPPSPAPPEDRPRLRPAPPAPTWQTATRPDLSGPDRPPRGSTRSARPRSGRPPGNHRAGQLVRRSTTRTTPDQHPVATRPPRQLPPELKRPPDSSQWHPGRRALGRCTQPEAPRHHRSLPVPACTMPGPAPTHLPKVQATRATLPPRFRERCSASEGPRHHQRELFCPERVAV
jgi:hypothetical protein